MAAYLLKRALLILPTMLGIMLISFVIVQFAPGGPVEQVIAKLTGSDTSISERMGGGSDTLGTGSQSQLGQGAAETVTSKYRGAQGLEPEFIKSLEKQFGFDKPAHERFFLMMKNYLTFDFGKSYFRDVSVLGADQGEAAGVDLARAVDDAHHLSHLDPARHPQGRARRRALRYLDVERARRRLRGAGLSRRRAPTHSLRRLVVLPVVPVARADLRQLGRARRSSGRWSTTSGILPCR